VRPTIKQVFIGRGPGLTHAAFERKLYVIRKQFEKAVAALDIPENKFAYIPSLSSNTLIYKGMLSADQIETMFPDLVDPDVESALALVHQRFSTNTFPSWPLAHPYRYVAHNGELCEPTIGRVGSAL
jgi:glutamate synthase domain-containing protein 1